MSIPGIRANEKAPAIVDEMLETLKAAHLPIADIGEMRLHDAVFKKSTAALQSFQATASPSAAFMDTFDVFASGPSTAADETIFGQVAQSLSALFKETEALRSSYNASVNDIIHHSVHPILAAESPSALKDRLEGSMRQYDRERNKKRNTDERKRISLSTQHRILQKTVCTYVQGFLDLRERRYFDFISAVTALFSKQLKYLHQSVAMLEKFLPDMQELNVLIAKEKEQCAQQKKVLRRYLNLAAQEVFSCERREHSMAQLERESKKMGKKHKRSASLGHELISIDGLIQSHPHDVADFLRVIFAIPANRVCADCAKPNPLYCLSDIGMLVCESCVQVHYIHRPHTCAAHQWSVLGRWSHQSHIVSLREKSLTTHDLFMPRAIGNEIANGLLEATLNQSGVKRPGPLDDKQEFIIAKYADFKFIAPCTETVSLTESLRNGKYTDYGVCSVLFRQCLCGADFEHADGVAALHLLIAEGNTLGVDFLLKNGVDPNQELNKNTALHVASQMERTECTKLLLRYGADFTKVNSENNTPIAIAQAFSSIGCSYLLAAASDDGDISSIANQPVFIESWSVIGNRDTEMRSNISLERSLMSPPVPPPPVPPPPATPPTHSRTNSNSSIQFMLDDLSSYNGKSDHHRSRPSSSSSDANNTTIVASTRNTDVVGSQSTLHPQSRTNTHSHRSSNASSANLLPWGTVVSSPPPALSPADGRSVNLLPHMQAHASYNDAMLTVQGDAGNEALLGNYRRSGSSDGTAPRDGVASLHPPPPPPPPPSKSPHSGTPLGLSRDVAATLMSPPQLRSLRPINGPPHQATNDSERKGRLSGGYDTEASDYGFSDDTGDDEDHGLADSSHALARRHRRRSRGSSHQDFEQEQRKRRHEWMKGKPEPIYAQISDTVTAESITVVGDNHPRSGILSPPVPPPPVPPPPAVVQGDGEHGFASIRRSSSSSSFVSLLNHDDKGREHDARSSHDVPSSLALHAGDNPSRSQKPRAPAPPRPPAATRSRAYTASKAGPHSLVASTTQQLPLTPAPPPPQAPAMRERAATYHLGRPPNKSAALRKQQQEEVTSARMDASVPPPLPARNPQQMAAMRTQSLTQVQADEGKPRPARRAPPPPQQPPPTASTAQSGFRSRVHSLPPSFPAPPPVPPSPPREAAAPGNEAKNDDFSSEVAPYAVVPIDFAQTLLAARDAHEEFHGFGDGEGSDVDEDDGWDAEKTITAQEFQHYRQQSEPPRSSQPPPPLPENAPQAPDEDSRKSGWKSKKKKKHQASLKLAPPRQKPSSSSCNSSSNSSHHQHLHLSSQQRQPPLSSSSSTSLSAATHIQEENDEVQRESQRNGALASMPDDLRVFGQGVVEDMEEDL